MSDKNFRCIIISEGASDGTVYEFQTQGEMEAFMEGVSEASSLYNAKQCGAYTAVDHDMLPPRGKQLIKQYLMENKDG